MNKQLEAEYLSYLQEHLEITPYHAVQGNYYEYAMGDNILFQPSPRYINDSNVLTEYKLFFQELGTFDETGLAPAIDSIERSGYIDLAGKFFTEDELKKAEQSQTYIRFASGARASIGDKPLLFLTNFEKEMSKACQTIVQEDLLGEDEFDLSGNPENNVPEHTHLLPNPKTGKRYLVTKYGSIVYESKNEFAIRGDMIFEKPNDVVETDSRCSKFLYRRLDGRCYFSHPVKKYLGGHSKMWYEPFQSIWKDQYNKIYCSTTCDGFNIVIHNFSKDKIQDLFKDRQNFGNQYLFYLEKGMINKPVQLHPREEQNNREKFGKEYVSKDGTLYSHQIKTGDWNFKVTVAKPLDKPIPWTSQYLYGSSNTKVAVYAKRHKLYIRLQEGMYHQNDSKRMITRDLGQANRLVIVNDGKGKNGLPIYITDTHSTFFINGTWVDVANELFGIHSFDMPNEAFLSCFPSPYVHVMSFTEFLKYRKTEEYHTKQKQRMLEQETQELLTAAEEENSKQDHSSVPTEMQIESKTNDELKIMLAKKIEELETILNQMSTLEQELKRRNTAMPKKITMSDDKLFIPVGDHLEILPWFLEHNLLPIINLSGTSFKNVKVSGIDFSGTNANMNPQTVYQKDMSHGIYDGLNFTMKSFEGVNTDGASFEGCIMDFVKDDPLKHVSQGGPPHSILKKKGK